MEFIAILKRVGPFVLTFAAGLIIASFFVTVTAPFSNWGSKRSDYKFSKSRHMKQKYHELRGEYMRMKLENEQLRDRVRSLEATRGFEGTELKLDGEVIEIPAPPPPPKPFRHMQMKTKIVEAQ